MTRQLDQQLRYTGLPIRTVVFVELANALPSPFMDAVMPWHGTALVASIVRDAGYDCEIFVEGISKIRVSRLCATDILFFTLSAGNIEVTRKLVGRIRRVRDVLVVGGGPLSKSAPEALMDFCDIVIRGEGDDAATELLEALNTRSPLTTVGGLSIARAEGPVHTPQRAFTRRFGVPTDLSLIAGFKTMSLVEQAVRRRAFLMTVESTRGCPYACKFCITPDLYGSYRTRDIDVVIADLRQRLQYSKRVWFIDNLFAVDKRYTTELLRRIKHEGLDTGHYTCFLRVENAAENQTLRAMVDAGFRSVLVGFESLRSSAQRAWRKNLQLEQMAKAIEAFNAEGLKVHGSFILGADGDTPEDVDATVEFGISAGLSDMCLFSLTPTQLAKNACIPRARNLAPSWDYMTGDYVTFFPTHCRPSQLQRAILSGYRRFYSPRRLPAVLERFGVAGVLDHMLMYRCLRRMWSHPHMGAYMEYLEAVESGMYTKDDVLVEARLHEDGVHRMPWLSDIDQPRRPDGRLPISKPKGRFSANACNDGHHE